VTAAGDDAAPAARDPAALVIARAPGDPEALAGLAALLDAERRAALQAVLVRRAAAWAAAAAPEAAFVALAGAGDVGALLPPGVTAFAADLPGAIARIGRGPLLIARADCPWLGPAHAAAALADLAAGCGVVFGAALDGGWYLAGLAEPRPELLTVAQDRAGGVGPVLHRARELGAEVGMLRHERVLATPEDAAALLADPLLPEDLRRTLDNSPEN
jgi:hypothetical protein